MTDEADLAEINRLHDEWWAANMDFDIPRMRACFVDGDKFLQYNLNGHTYWSLAELTQLWETIAPAFGIPEQEVIDYRVEVRGDMAWVSHEAKVKLVAKEGFELPPTIPAELRIRETEVYIREDSEGNPVWKIWHHHCSPHAPDDEVRMGFQDSVLTREAG